MTTDSRRPWCFLHLLGRVPVCESTADSLESEYITCIGQPLELTDIDPIAWWVENDTRFSLLAPVALNCLTMQATSVPIERVFSKAGFAYKGDVIVFLVKRCAPFYACDFSGTSASLFVATIATFLEELLPRQSSICYLKNSVLLDRC